jgi:hypothetical protein
MFNRCACIQKYRKLAYIGTSSLTSFPIVQKSTKTSSVIQLNSPKTLDFTQV